MGSDQYGIHVDETLRGLIRPGGKLSNSRLWWIVGLRLVFLQDYVAVHCFDLDGVFPISSLTGAADILAS